MKLNTVNVIETLNGVVSAVYSFSNDDIGIKEAEDLFRSIIFEQDVPQHYKDNVESYIEDGECSIDDCSLVISHSI